MTSYCLLFHFILRHDHKTIFIQCCIESSSYLNCDFFIYPTQKLVTIMGALLHYLLKNIKPLYSISKVYNH